jgi:SulP family sulfate permease
VPVSRELPGYRAGKARRDLVAGLTVAALALPSGMAYAEVAGLSPVHGLYALLLPTIAYALLGSSRRLVIGPEGSISALVAVAVLGLAASGSGEAAELAATLALLVGACYALALVLRLGWLADYFSRPVLLGYIHGVAVVLVIGQLGKLLGLDVDVLDPVPQLVEVAREIGQTSGATVAVSVLALSALIPLRFVAPRFPGPLVVVIVGIGASAVIGLDERGVSVVGTIPDGLPDFGLPMPSWDHVFELAPAAIGLFFVSFADEILTARSYSQKHGERVGVGQELRAMGAANVAGGLTQGFPVGASGSRTAVNDAMGARSQVAGILAAAAILLILLFLTGPIADLPKAVLGAAIVSAAIGLVNPGAWRRLAAADRVELAIAAVTAAGVVVAGVLEAVTLAVGLTIVDAVRRSARPGDAVLGWDDELGRWADISAHPQARVAPAVVVYRLDDRLFFANSRYVMKRMQEAVRGASVPARWLVLDAEAVTHVDSTGAEALGRLAGTLREEGVNLVVARMRRRVQRELAKSGLVERIGSKHFYPTVRAAVAACAVRDAGDATGRLAGVVRPPHVSS